MSENLVICETAICEAYSFRHRKKLYLVKLRGNGGQKDISSDLEVIRNIFGLQKFGNTNKKLGNLLKIPIILAN